MSNPEFKFAYDYRFQFDESESSTNSVNWEDKLSYTFTDLPAGTYRIAFYTEAKVQSSAQKYYIRYTVDGTEKCSSSGQNTGQEDWVMSTGFIRLIVTEDGSHTFKIQWCASSSQHTAYIRRARIELWRFK